MTDIWQACNGEQHIQPIENEALRIVESQSRVATTHITDTLDEQYALELMLEHTKPNPDLASEQRHYLLSTPFRYPPLKHGSRFGTFTEPSLMYGSHSLETVLAESAHYRKIFWRDMSVPPKNNKFITHHTVFAFRYYSPRGIKLHQAPFTDYTSTLRGDNYHDTQLIGQNMRHADVQVFEFTSARCPNAGVNVALYNPDALSVNEPLDQQNWLCETTASQIKYFADTLSQTFQFPVAEEYNT